MKQRMLVPIALLLLVPLLPAPAALADEAPDAGQQIERLVDQIFQAAADPERLPALQQMIPSDALVIGPGGRVNTFAEVVKGFQSGQFAVKSYENSESKIVVRGDTAVANLRSLQVLKQDGHETPALPFRVTMVFHRGAEGWQLLAVHATFIGDLQPPAN